MLVKSIQPEITPPDLLSTFLGLFKITFIIAIGNSQPLSNHWTESANSITDVTPVSQITILGGKKREEKSTIIHKISHFASKFYLFFPQRWQVHESEAEKKADVDNSHGKQTTKTAT